MNKDQQDRVIRILTMVVTTARTYRVRPEGGHEYVYCIHCDVQTPNHTRSCVIGQTIEMLKELKRS